MFDIKKSRTTLYHAAGNGLCERTKKVISMIGTLQEEQKANWADLSTLVHAYNATKHESTGYSPFHLMFGREPRLPVDVQFGLKSGAQSHTEFAKALSRKLQKAFEIADQASHI